MRLRCFMSRQKRQVCGGDGNHLPGTSSLSVSLSHSLSLLQVWFTLPRILKRLRYKDITLVFGLETCYHNFTSDCFPKRTNLENVQYIATGNIGHSSYSCVLEALVDRCV
jgi:hypothetical protein